MSNYQHTRAICAAIAFIVLAPGVTSSQEVTLPLEEFESLRKRATRPATPPPRPEVAFTVEEATIEIHAGRASARVTERLTLSIYEGGWQTIPLATIGSLSSAELGALEGRVSLDGGGRLKVRGRGRHEVLLRSVVAITEDSTSARPISRLSFDLPAAGMVSGFIEAAEDVDEILLGEGALPRGDFSNGRLEFVGDPGRALEVALLTTGGATDRAALPLKFEATSSTVTLVGRTVVDAKSFVTATVLQGEMESLRLTLPPGFEVIRVEPDTLGWDVEAEQTLTIRPPGAASSHLAATVILSSEPRASFISPLLVPLDAVRLSLLTGLRMEADGIPLLLDAGVARRAEPGDLRTLPDAVQQTLARAFVVHDPERPPRWNIEWSDASQQPVLATQVDRLIVDVLVGEAGVAGYQCWLEVRTNGSMNLTFEPPPGFELSKATRDGETVTPGVSAGGLAIPLAASRGVQTIHIEGVVPMVIPPVKGDFAIPLPSFSDPVGGIEVRAVLPGERRFELATAFDRGTDRLPSGMFRAPLGYSIHRARWSALTATPEPLSFRVRSQRSKRRWF